MILVYFNIQSQGIDQINLYLLILQEDIKYRIIITDEIKEITLFSSVFYYFIKNVENLLT